MKTQYPNGQNKEQYVNVIILHYKSRYPNFSSRQIRKLIQRMANYVDCAITEFQTLKYQKKSLSVLRELLQRPANFLNDENETLSTIAYHAIGDEDTIKIQMKAHCDTSLPDEDLKLYLDFASSATRYLIEQLVSSTEEKIKKEQKSVNNASIGREGPCKKRRICQ